MFLYNKYTKCYNNIVERAKSRKLDGYSETHHIIPRSLGGDNRSGNLVKLTPREHYICHALLVHMVSDPKHIRSMYAAFNMMHVDKNGRRYTSKLYDYYKIKFYKRHSEQQKGRVRSIESRQKQSKSSRGKPWSEKKKASAWVGPTAKAVIATVYKTGEYVGRYDSISLAAKELGCDTTAVWKILTGWKSKTPDGKMRPYKSHHGYTFQFVNSDDD